jgi:hypothetical protein
MFLAVQPTTQRCEHSFKIAAHQRSWIQPKSGELNAFEQALDVRRDLLVLPFSKFPPKYAPFAGNPRQVLAHAIAPIRIFLLVQVISPGAGDDLNDQVRWETRRFAIIAAPFPVC